MANYVLLDRIELNATATSVTFDNIPQTGYTDLKIVMSARDTSTAGANWNGYSFTIYPNGLSTNITQRSLFGNGSGVSSYSDTQMYNVIDMGSDTANTFSNVEIYIPNYTSSAFKSFSIDGVAEANATNTGMRLSAGLWSSTAAITSIRLNPFSVFAIGSTFSLYGVAKLGTTPAVAPKANGGNVIGTDGTYWYHAFLSNGTFTPQTALSADVLVVAGGGAGGNSYGGGGGAGGVIYFAGQSLTSGAGSTVTVGAGGSGIASGTSGSGNNGNNSTFASLAAAIGGGGGGGNAGAEVGRAGGSGGGGSRNSATGGASTQTGTGATAYYGNVGGGVGSVNQCAGGGGAGAAGTAGGSTTGGNGGNGTTAFSSWGLATVTGQNSGGTVYYAGGGAGNGTGAAGTAGLGGGALPGVAATANTGGGGADNNSAGGSGIVIVRYLVA